MEYELHFKKITKIKKFGTFNLENTTDKLAVISFVDIKNNNGYISKFYYIFNSTFILMFDIIL